MQNVISTKSTFKIEPKHTTHSGGKGEYLHDWYPYLEGFSSSFVNEILKMYSPNAMRVLEPFSGVGTTVINSSILGYTSYYCEINPILRKVTDLKIQVLNLSRKDRLDLSKKIINLYTNLKKNIEVRYSPMSRPNNHKIKIELG